MAAHTMQCKVIVPELTNQRYLAFKNHPEVVLDEFLANPHVYCCKKTSIKMAKDYPRSNQIGQQIKKEIAEILQYEIQHPTLVNVTITDLELSKDLRHAKIYFISKQDQIELEKALKRSMSFIRQSLSKRMTPPGLIFLINFEISESGLHSFP